MGTHNVLRSTSACRLWQVCNARQQPVGDRRGMQNKGLTGSTRARAAAEAVMKEVDSSQAPAAMADSALAVRLSLGATQWVVR